MDRFFKAYNEELLQKGHNVTWFFSGGKRFDFYSDLNIIFPDQQESLEELVLNRLKQTNPFDVMVTHFLPLCTAFYKKIKVSEQPYIIAVDHNPRPLQGFSLKKRIKNRIKGKLYSKYINCFVGVSKYTVTHILQDYGSDLKEKTKVVYNGIDTSVYLKRKEGNCGKFIVASHLRESKGIQDLIEAVNLLPEEKKQFLKIDIFGEGPLEVTLKGKVKKYQLGQQIRFKGSSSRLPELFQQYSFLLQPTYMECFSLSILESLAANVPVITTPIGGNPEIITPGENGYFFEPKNIFELKDLLQKALNNALKINDNVNLVIEERFNLQEMVSNHIKLLKI